MIKKYTEQIMGVEARRELLEGARLVYEPVSATLGVRGRNVLISKYHDLQVLHDGVLTAESVNPENKYHYAGAQVLKEAGRKQLQACGDGTTCSILLGYEIAREALKIVESGVNPMSLREAFSTAGEILTEYIEKQSEKVKTRKQMIEVACVSAGESKLGEIIGDTWHKAGPDGVVTINDDPAPETFVEHEEGLQIDSGYVSEFFVTNPNNMTAQIHEGAIIVTDHKLSDIYKLAPLLKGLVEKHQKRNIVIIASEITGSVLATLVQNKMKGNFNTLAIKAPTFKTKEYLQDMAAFVGGRFLSKETDPDLSKVDLSDLGYADRVTSSRDASIIVGGGGDKKIVDARIKDLKQQIKNEDNEFNRIKLQERLGKLQGGIYVLNIGAQTEAEGRERKERADDAVRATQVAIETGIVAGGETIYLSAGNNLIAKDESEEYAYRIVKNALKKPFAKLVENAGYNSGVLMERLSKTTVKNPGVDVTTGEIVNMYEAGIIDPAGVSINVIRNALSVAAIIICAEGVVTEHEVSNVQDK